MASDTQKHSTQIHMQKYLRKNVRQKNSDCTVKINPKNLFYRRERRNQKQTIYVMYAHIYIHTYIIYENL